MLRVAIYVTFLSICVCHVTEACLFTDCPNEFSWSKKNYDSAAIMRMMVDKIGQIGVGKRLFKCDDKPIGGEFPQCEFRGTKVCCHVNVFRSMECQVTSIESVPLEEPVIERISNALESYITSVDPDSEKEKCVNVGFCCTQGDCTPETSCTSTWRSEDMEKSTRNELNQLLRRLMKNENKH